MTDVSIVGAVLAGLVSFLSPCVLPLVPGYVSMLSGIGIEQLRQEEPPRAGLFATSLAFVAGFSFVFISFGASASAVGFERGRMMGRGVPLAIPRTIDSVNAPAWADDPIRTVGCTRRTTSSSVIPRSPSRFHFSDQMRRNPVNLFSGQGSWLWR